MAQAQKGLGRGLEALLGGYRDERTAQDVQTITLDAIRANPEQPRRIFSSQPLEDLAASIREQGVLQPVLVRPVAGGGAVAYEIVAGERRWRAARLAGLTDIPALVREVDDEQSLALALIENLQREDLNPMEQAEGLGLLQSRFGMSQEALARKVGMSRPAVANTLRLLQLPETMRADLASGSMTPGHARALLSLADDGLRQELWRRILDAGLSVRQAEDSAAWARTHGCLPEAQTKAATREETPKRRSTKPAVDRVLRGIEDSITRQCGILVKTTGTVDHGKVTFQFSSRRELSALLDRLGLSLVEEQDAAP
jgi:ParB family transcriptional regulator, chromosome partitioning protein